MAGIAYVRTPTYRHGACIGRRTSLLTLPHGRICAAPRDADDAGGRRHATRRQGPQEGRP